MHWEMRVMSVSLKVEEHTRLCKVCHLVGSLRVCNDNFLIRKIVTNVPILPLPWSAWEDLVASWAVLCAHGNMHASKKFNFIEQSDCRQIVCFYNLKFQQWITVQAFPTTQTTQQLLFQNKALHAVSASQSQQCSWGGTKACLVLAGLIDQCSGWLYTTYRPGFLQFKEEGDAYILLQEPLDDLL